MASATKQPKFFCENCGAHVEKWDIQCKKCGRIFDSIKCPQCGFMGNANDFPNGCPKCGFHSSSLTELTESINKARQAPSNKDAVSGKKIRKDSSNERVFSSVFYLVIIGILSAVILALIIPLIMILSNS